MWAPKSCFPPCKVLLTKNSKKNACRSTNTWGFSAYSTSTVRSESCLAGMNSISTILLISFVLLLTYWNFQNASQELEFIRSIVKTQGQQCVHTYYWLNQMQTEELRPGSRSVHSRKNACKHWQYLLRPHTKVEAVLIVLYTDLQICLTSVQRSKLLHCINLKRITELLVGESMIFFSI